MKSAAAVAGLVLLAACSKPSNEREAPPANPPAANPPAATPGATPAATPGAPNGLAVFQGTCQMCHQANGQGNDMYPPLVGSPYVNGDKGKLIRLVLHGMQGPITVHGKRYNNIMPPWKGKTDAEIAAVLTYVRSNFTNTSSAITAGEVAQQRAATSSRTTPWTVAELEASR